MKELHEILSTLSHLPKGGPPAVLATLIKVSGSSYRGMGARMLVLPDGSAIGALSGGCLEKDVVAHAEQVRAESHPRLLTYDLTKDDEAPWGLGMGCAARLEVLLEPVAGSGLPEHLAFVAEAVRRRQAVVVATVFRTDAQTHGRTDAPAVGDRLMLTADGRAAGALLNGSLGAAVLQDARRVLREERPDVVLYQVGGPLEVSLEFVPRPIALVVAGGGSDIAPLVRLAGELGWQVTVLGKDDLPGALDDWTAAVVMTHNYWRDGELLEALLPSPVRYAGLLGPRARAERLLEDLRKRGVRWTEAQASRLHAPVGLDIGAETPEEIALAVLAEVRAAFAGRAGGALRDRKEPIHDRR